MSEEETKPADRGLSLVERWAMDEAPIIVVAHLNSDEAGSQESQEK